MAGGMAVWSAERSDPGNFRLTLQSLVACYVQFAIHDGGTRDADGPGD